MSKTRVWGVPLPIFIKRRQEFLVDDECLIILQNLRKRDLIVGFRMIHKNFLGKKYKAEDFEKLSDIVEVWFDSGSTHSFVLEKEKI